jgi:Xaa-Pro aminopeptidase
VLVQATDVFYFAGTRQNAALWVPAAGAAALLVRKSLARARAESAIDDVRPFPRSRELGAVAAGARRVGFTSDVAPHNAQRFWATALAPAELVDVSPAVRWLRSVKSPAELAAMRRTGAMLSAVLAEVPRFLRPGMRELDLAAEIEYRMRRAGNEGSPRLRGFNQELFTGLVAAGARAAVPGSFDGPVIGAGLGPSAPIGPSDAVIEAGAPIVLDYTAIVGGYIVDMTRLAVCGELPAPAARAFDVALEIQRELAARLVPGAVPCELWDRACAMAEEAGLAASFMGPPGDQARFVGHGVGLELDELPVLAPGFEDALVAGQTLALEPKFVFPGLGAAGIENTWAVAPAGGERLTALDDAVLRAG